MSANIATYLDKILDQALSAPEDRPERFRMAAITLLRQSAEYKRHHWDRLRFVAQDLKRANLSQIKLAKKYPDIFHPNVALSREEENRVYDEVISLITQADHPRTA